MRAHRLAANASGTDHAVSVQNEGGDDGATLKQLLLKALHRFTHSRLVATCQSGYGAVCKTVYPGSIPGVASNPPNLRRLII